MSLASILRDALERGHQREPMLIAGDILESEERLEAGDEGGGPMPAAVLVAVVDRPEPGVILTLRPETMRRHPGQISFPGGRVDPGDKDAVAAALREAQEEIGLDPATVEIIGIADRYRTITGFEITPVVGIVTPPLDLHPHPGEVAELFEAPLHYLLDPAHQISRKAEYQGVERAFFEIDYQGRRIWGATAAMIVNLSRRLVLA